MEGNHCFLHPSVAFQPPGPSTCCSGLRDRVRWVKADFSCHLKPGLVSNHSHLCSFCLVSAEGLLLHSLLVGEFLVPFLVQKRPELGTTILSLSLHFRCSSIFPPLFGAQLPCSHFMPPAHISCNCYLCSCPKAV